MTEWNHIEDEKPYLGQPIIMCADYRQAAIVGWWDGIAFRTWDSGCIAPGMRDVTHWAPLTFPDTAQHDSTWEGAFEAYARAGQPDAPVRLKHDDIQRLIATLAPLEYEARRLADRIQQRIVVKKKRRSLTRRCEDAAISLFAARAIEAIRVALRELNKVDTIFKP